MASVELLAALLVYLLAGRGIVMRLTGAWRERAFGLLNVTGVYWFLFHGGNTHFLLRFAIYVALVVFQYVLVRYFSEQRDWKAWLAFGVPILALIVIRYMPPEFYRSLGSVLGMAWRGNPDLVGISYLAFRSSHLVIEVRNGVVKRPGFWEYVGFCFFLPTMSVGPINSYSNHRRGFDARPPEIAVGRALLRIIVGLVKYQFLGSVFNRLTYSGLLVDDHPHPWMDLPVAMVFYYLYLYCNFSGFCDLAIGAAGLMGIPVAENFNNPFGARNLREFWNRWHITLSSYMRDVVFAPLSKFFARILGAENVNHAVALTIVAVFLLIGVWHGAGWNFASYGAAHALGVVANHYYTIFLKKRLGRDGFKAYNANRWIQAVAVTCTFCYCAATLVFFANSFPQLREILSSLR